MLSSDLNGVALSAVSTEDMIHDFTQKYNAMMTLMFLQKLALLLESGPPTKE